MKLARMMRSRKGFTLVELMVVVVIIGVLVAIAIPLFSNVSANAKAKANEANIRTIEGAITTYLANTGDTGGYDAVVLGTDGAISGTDITAGNLVTDGYLKEMPDDPINDGKTYAKAASGDVVNNQ